MDTDTRPLDPRRREAHPEHITVGDETFDRNDVSAANYGESERSHNRRDQKGAPYVSFGGVKYRPRQRLAAHILAGIQERKPQRIVERSRPRRR